MDRLFVVLVNTRFPENIGMAARACANMGCNELRLVAPERWLPEKALPLATPKALSILENVRIFPSLEEALADAHTTYGTTARIGGWRGKFVTPWKAAGEISRCLQKDLMTGLVFGPEDKGLTNAQITLCQHLIHIPTYGGASSLNLAQSVLLVLYECAKAVAQDGNVPAQRHPNQISMEDRLRLEGSFKDLLLKLDCLHGNNPDYFFMQWQNIFTRAGLRRHEYDALMGFCRQIRNKMK